MLTVFADFRQHFIFLQLGTLQWVDPALRHFEIGQLGWNNRIGDLKVGASISKKTYDVSVLGECLQLNNKGHVINDVTQLKQQLSQQPESTYEAEMMEDIFLK